MAFLTQTNLELASRAKNVAIFTLGAETAFSGAMYHNSFFYKIQKCN